jgi:hypothetical protein
MFIGRHSRVVFYKHRANSSVSQGFGSFVRVKTGWLNTVSVDKKQHTVKT